MERSGAARGILFDIDGVFYVGDDPVPGAADAVRWADAEAVPYLFVTNTTSHPRTYLVDKLARFGVVTTSDRILTPAVAARARLVAATAGPVALFVPAQTAAEFHGLTLLDESEQTGAAAVVLGDLGTQWDFATLNRAFRLLMADARPVLVSLGMTRYWRDADGLHLDVGPFTRALEFATGVEAVVTGKPAAAFFAAAGELLGLPPTELVMVGDDIRGDIQGAQSAGLRGLLVRTGKFDPADLQLGVTPDGVLDSVAGLPQWWTSAP